MVNPWPQWAGQLAMGMVTDAAVALLNVRGARHGQAAITTFDDLVRAAGRDVAVHHWEQAHEDARAALVAAGVPQLVTQLEGRETR